MKYTSTKKLTSFLSQTSDWYQAVARPNVLLDASVVLRVYHQGVLPGMTRGFTKQVTHYQNGFATYYRSAAQMNDILGNEYLQFSNNIQKVQEYGAIGADVLQEADDCLREAETLQNIEQVKAFIPKLIETSYRSIRFITLIPYLTLNQIEKAGYTSTNPGPYREAFEALEFLRADSRILLFREKLYPNIWRILGEYSSYEPELLNHISVEELQNFVTTNILPSKAELLRRKEGCVLWFDEEEILQIIFDPELISEVSKLDLPEILPTMITGTVACAGKATGKVRIAYTSDDLKNFTDGDVIVSSSTSPNLTPFLKRAGAIVTDEGGIASHAAIISRELQKPCIIGTKIATKVLKNGDLVEVDADNGRVSILKKAER